MQVISVRIPQLGEGLQEALLVDFLKQPGETVARDEPIYVMETDKATTDVESPYEGKLIEWTVKTGSVLSIGTEIARMEVADGVKEMPSGHGPPAETLGQAPAAAAATGTSVTGTSVTGASATGTSATGESNNHAHAPAESPVAVAAPVLLPVPSDKPGRAVRRASVTIPPRTRKYLKEKGLIDVCDQIPAAGSKLMPNDVDLFLTALAAGGTSAAARATESELPQSQVTLNYRLGRGTKVVVPVTVINEINWTRINTARQLTRDTNGPTGFSMSCWCVVQVLKKHPKFRSVFSADGRMLKTFGGVNLGIAVALPGDEMLTAVVRNADVMSQHDFFAAVVGQIKLARTGNDQADEATTLTVSNIGKAGMRIGIPAVVAPAVATLAFGEVYDQPVPDGDSFKFQKSLMATLSFDHRIVNGVGAGNFLSDVKQSIENFSFSI